MGYFDEMNEMFKKDIKKRQESFTDPDYSVGEFISTPEEFFEDVYRTFLDDEKRRTFLVGKEFNTQFKCEDLRIVQEKYKNFQFFTPSVFWHHKLRTKDQLIWITEITLDFDLTQDGTGREYDHHELAIVLKNEFGYTPNYVWTSRTNGNLQANYLIKPMTGTEKSIYYFEAIARRMAILVGADVVATSSVNLYCIPKKGAWKFTDMIHDIDDFSNVLEDVELESTLTKLRNKNVVSFTERQILKSEAIKMLLDAEFESHRNNAAFTIALLYYALGKSAEEAAEFLNGEWYDKVNDGRIYSSKGKFKRKEVKTVVKSAFGGRYHGPSKEWIYLITGVDFHFNLYKSSYIKKENGYQSGDEVKRKIVDWVRENDGVTIKRQVLCEELGIADKSYRRAIEVLKSEGIIDYETELGRYSKGTTFYSVAQSTPFVIEADTSVNVDNIIDYFKEDIA